MKHTSNPDDPKKRLRDLQATRHALIESCQFLAGMLDLNFNPDDPHDVASLLMYQRGDPLLRANLDKALDGIHTIDQRIRELREEVAAHAAAPLTPPIAKPSAEPHQAITSPPIRKLLTHDMFQPDDPRYAS